MRERDTVYRLSSQFSKFNMIRFRFGEWRIDEFGCHSDHLSMGWFVGYDCFLYFPISNIGFIGWGSNLHLFPPMRCSSVFIRFCIFCMDEECSLCFKKTWPPSHETKWCGDKRGDISAILRVFPSGSLQCPVTRIPLDIEQDPGFFGRDSSWKPCHVVAERCWKYPPLRNVSRQEWVANTKKTPGSSRRSQRSKKT